MKSFLIISPQKETVSQIKSAIVADSHIHLCEDLDSAYSIHRQHNCDVLFVDLNVLQPDRSPISFSKALQPFRESNPMLSIVILAPKNDIRKAVKLVKTGANDYLSYPIDSSEVHLVIETLQASLTQNLELGYLRDRFWKTEWLDRIHTRADSMR